MIQIIATTLSLIGAFTSGVIVTLLNHRFNRPETYRTLVQNARIAFEKWEASKIGPGENIYYEGLDSELLDDIIRKAHEDFFERYFNTSFELKASLGPIRDLDERIDDALNNSSWKIEDEDIDQLREALIILQGDKHTLIKSIKKSFKKYKQKLHST